MSFSLSRPLAAFALNRVTDFTIRSLTQFGGEKTFFTFSVYRNRGPARVHFCFGCDQSLFGNRSWRGENSSLMSFFIAAPYRVCSQPGYRLHYSVSNPVWRGENILHFFVYRNRGLSAFIFASAATNHCSATEVGGEKTLHL